MNSLIIEDEPNSTRLLGQMLAAYCPDVTVIGDAQKVSDAVKLIREKQPALIFLDIEIIEGTGFDVLKEFPNPDFKVIFITGYDEYAIRAFKFNAVDYLLKPINKDELISAVEQAKILVNQKEALEQLSQYDGKKTPEHLIITDRQGSTKLLLEDIVMLKASGAYCEFFSMNSKKIIASKAIGYFEEFLPSDTFVRIHHGAIVNLKHVLSFDSTRDAVNLRNEMTQEVSYRKKKDFMDKFKKM